jgi:hypothetical protein
MMNDLKEVRNKNENIQCNDRKGASPIIINRFKEQDEVPQKMKKAGKKDFRIRPWLGGLR